MKRPASRQPKLTAQQRQGPHQASRHWEHARRPAHSRGEPDAQPEPQGAPHPLVQALGLLLVQRQQAWRRQLEWRLEPPAHLRQARQQASQPPPELQRTSLA